MSTLIVTSVVVVYAIASMAYVASSEQRATRHRHRGRAHLRPSLALPAIPRTLPRPNVTLPDWLQAPPEQAFEFIRPAPVELEPAGLWPRVRSSAALLVLLTVVGAVVAIVLGVAAVLTVLALKNAAG